MQSAVYWTEILALLSMLYFHRKHGSARTMILVIILSSVVLVETIMQFELSRAWHLALINLAIATQMSLYMFFYISLMRIGGFSKFMVFYLLFYIVFWMVDSIFFHPMTENLQSYVYILGALGVLIFILGYVHQDLLKSQRVSPPHHRYLLWISGALFFYLATEIPIMTMIQYMVENELGISAVPIFEFKFVVTLIYYITYPIALIWAKTV